MVSAIEANDIVKSVDTRIRPQAEELAQNVLTMATKLSEIRNQIESAPIVCEYDNGGGQTGIRENPIFTAYEKLLSTYMKGISTLQTLIGDNAPAEANNLTELRARFRVAK